MNHDKCGGLVLVSGTGVYRHHYCDRCGAFAYVDADGNSPDALPTGVDREVNRAAFDAGETASPPDASAK